MVGGALHAWVAEHATQTTAEHTGHRLYVRMYGHSVHGSRPTRTLIFLRSPMARPSHNPRNVHGDAEHRSDRRERVKPPEVRGKDRHRYHTKNRYRDECIPAEPHRTDPRFFAASEAG